jgi:hypothetical protein
VIKFSLAPKSNFFFLLKYSTAAIFKDIYATISLSFPPILDQGAGLLTHESSLPVEAGQPCEVTVVKVVSTGPLRFSGHVTQMVSICTEPLASCDA